MILADTHLNTVASENPDLVVGIRPVNGRRRGCPSVEVNGYWKKVAVQSWSSAHVVEYGK